MKITKELAKDFIENNFLEIYQIEDKIMTVGIKWGYCKKANENYGKQNVLKILDLLENNKEYQKLLLS